MATGDYADFKIYNEQYYAGMYETVARNLNAFNGASNNAIILINEKLKGHYEYESFIQKVSMVNRRDISSVGAATDTALTQEEEIGVKLNRRLGPIGQTMDSWKKIGEDPKVMSFILGQMAGDQKLEDYLDSILYALEAALDNITDVETDKTGATTKTMTHSHLVDAMSTLGDKANRISAWVMHSKPFFDLVGQAISDKITNVADTVIYGGSPGTLGKPVVVTDSAALKNDNGSATDTYNTLGLVQAAGVVKESEPENVVFKEITGKDNLIYRYQGEYAFNLRIKGSQWDVGNGGLNPNDATLATATNWDQVATSYKDCAGVHLLTQ